MYIHYSIFSASHHLMYIHSYSLLHLTISSSPLSPHLHSFPLPPLLTSSSPLSSNSSLLQFFPLSPFFPLIPSSSMPFLSLLLLPPFFPLLLQHSFPLLNHYFPLSLPSSSIPLLSPPSTNLLQPLPPFFCSPPFLPPFLSRLTAPTPRQPPTFLYCRTERRHVSSPWQTVQTPHHGPSSLPTSMSTSVPSPARHETNTNKQQQQQQQQQRQSTRPRPQG